MKVKRYFASSMRSALDMIKQEQGPDVLILSNRKVDGGVELVTADELTEQEAERLVERTASKRVAERADRPPADRQRTPDATARPISDAFGEGQNYLWTDDGTVQQMRSDLASLKGLLETQLSGLAWSDFDNRHPLRARLLRVLSKIGISVALSRELVAEVPDELDYHSAWHHVLAVLMARLNVLDDPVIKDAGRVAVVGPTGVGKSTLVSKLAARYALAHGPESVVIISMDDRRLGAHQQMKSFGRLIGCAVHTLRDCDELAALLETIDKRPLVLIDTPGNSPQHPRFRELVLGLDALGADIQLYQVMSATTDYLAASRTLRMTAELALDACVLTKLDEAATLGPSLSSIIEAGMPLAYTSAGQRVPDDLDVVDARALLERCVSLAEESPAGGDGVQLEQAFSV